MKTALFFAAALATLATPAFSADLPALKSPPVSPPQIWSWTGCYVGVNIGIASLKTSASDSDSGYEYDGSNTGTGVIGGGQIGCDYQLDKFVLGAQGSIDALSSSGKNAPSDPDTGEMIGTKGEWLATLTARAGYLIQPQLLLYVTGGLAWLDVDYSDNSSSYTGSASATRLGGLIGGGLEYALTKNVSVFGEFDYIDFGRTTTTLSYSDSSTYYYTYRHDVDRFIVGVNYKF